MDDISIKGVLQDGLATLGVELGSAQITQLLQYLQLLQKWNKAYNLTAVSDPEAMVRLHLLDSLAILPFLSGDRFIDVGTGPGLPGIPLAIAAPDKNFTLLDSNGKRIRFLFQVRQQLALQNVGELHHRAESYAPENLFDGVISRAFTHISDMLSKTAHLLVGDGKFYAMKGRYPEKELSELGKGFTVSACHHLDVPGIDGERHLVEIAISPAGIAL